MFLLIKRAFCNNLILAEFRDTAPLIKQVEEIHFE